jgi:ribosomal protein S28E/S33
VEERTQTLRGIAKMMVVGTKVIISILPGRDVGCTISAAVPGFPESGMLLTLLNATLPCLQGTMQAMGALGRGSERKTRTVIGAVVVGKVVALREYHQECLLQECHLREWRKA